MNNISVVYKGVKMDNTKRVTIYDIAREAGVSASQVSRAISGNGYVSEENKAKIQTLVDRYDYKPSAMARNLQKGTSNMIGFLIPHISDEYFSYVYYRFEEEMKKKGYITVVFNGKSTPWEEIPILHLLEEIRVDALVIIGGSLDGIDWSRRREYVEIIQSLSQKIPCILGNERAGQLNCAGVCANIDGGAEALVAHLAEQGFRTMGILGGLESVQPSVRLQEALKEQAEKRGIEFRPQWRVHSSYNARDGAEAMRTLLQQKELPEVVCCINDEIAIGAMGVALDAGLKIPRDIAFTGYDGVYLSQEFRPQLTTIQMDFAAMGHALAQAVEEGLSGKGSSTVTSVDPWLEVRQSTLR